MAKAGLIFFLCFQGTRFQKHTHHATLSGWAALLAWSHGCSSAVHLWPDLRSPCSAAGTELDALSTFAGQMLAQRDVHSSCGHTSLSQTRTRRRGEAEPLTGGAFPLDSWLSGSGLAALPMSARFIPTAPCGIQTTLFVFREPEAHTVWGAGTLRKRRQKYLTFANR